MEKLILIDGNSLINRAFYATPPMSNSKGQPTNAVFGFINMLVKLIGEEYPDYMLVAFDRKEPTFRHKMYAEYKGTRKPMPEDLRPQIPLLKEVLSAMGITCYELPGSEADDIIGTASRKYRTQNIIITGDKDAFQLVNKNTSVYFTKRGISDLEVLTNDNFTDKIGIEPLQIIDLKALMGDKSDNIPGIPGVGEKTAMDLLIKYGSAENLYENITDLKGKLQEKVALGKEMCLLSKTLATIDVGVDLNLSLDDIRFSMPFPSKARNKFAELEFRNIIKKDSLYASEDFAPVAEVSTLRLPESFTVTEKSQLSAISLEKISINISNNISISDGKTEYLIPIKQSFFDEGFLYDEAVKMLSVFTEDKDRTIIFYSSKLAEKNLKEFGVNLYAHVEDVSLQKYIAEFTGSDEGLEAVMLYHNLPVKYPAFSLCILHDMYNGMLVKNGQQSLYYDIELPLAKVLFDMESTGFRVDEKIINDLHNKYTAMIKDLTEKIYALAGEKFNLNSPKQLGYVLFDKLKLYSGKRKKNNYSTSADVLEEIADDHEIVPLILQYRRISKLNSTYVEGFKPLIDKSTGLIHTVFNQTLTTTGRLSSKEPNLQNLPVRDEDGKEIRSFFIPSDSGHILVGADYSQIELRLLAHYSKCEKLIEAYNTGVDIHTVTASQVFGVPMENVTKEMRRSAKAVNFGIIYGISEYGLAKNIKVSAKVAKAYIEKYFESYPHVKEFMQNNVEFARKNGFVSTLFGRKRYIKDINSPNYNLRSFSERAAMNMPLQGSSADIIKIAMIRVHNRFKNENLKSKLILQVHDELVVDTLLSEQNAVERILKEEMEGAAQLLVPLEVEVYSGRNLSEAK